MSLDLSEIFLSATSTGKKGFPKEAIVAAFIVMKCEGFSQITDLADNLDNNRLIAHYCNFDITRELPSYWTYDRFIRNIDNDFLKQIKQSQVLKLTEIDITNIPFFGPKSTAVFIYTKYTS